jgi:DNA-binding CsgD family transcriptional regulator
MRRCMAETGSRLAPAELLARLSAVEREALDHAMQLRTSKEIARLTNTKKPTVEARISRAITKLGAQDRKEAVRTYRALLEHYDRIPCDPVQLSDAPLPALTTPPELEPVGRFTLADAAPTMGLAPWESTAGIALSEVLDRRFSKAWRAVAIPLIALGLGMLALVALAVSQVLGMLI